MDEDQGTNLERALTISDEILSDIENTDLTFEQILLKCKKLARLRDDFEALNWFTAELHGYGTDVQIPGITREDLERYAEMSGRFTVSINPETKKEERKYWQPGVCRFRMPSFSSMGKYPPPPSCPLK